MCESCGCSDGADAKVINLQTGKTLDTAATHHHHGDAQPNAHRHEHEHGHDHHHHEPDGHHEHSEHHGRASTVLLERDILAKNDLIARNRAWFAGREILALNLVSGPGAGKTTLLERTVRHFQHLQPCFVIEGDQATANDGLRIKDAGAPVVQINTGSGCHLDAEMVARGLAELRPSFGSAVLIENVGNLVCPAMFDLGERAKVAILSVPEGEDKPIKYPHMFQAASLLLINKIDLLPYIEFNLDRCISYARQVNASIEILTLSATTGEGLDSWYHWVSNALNSERGGLLPENVGATP